jgi:murein DD-endopeptidase MepM/ murein hydrolase activator NlpD
VGALALFVVLETDLVRRRPAPAAAPPALPPTAAPVLPGAQAPAPPGTSSAAPAPAPTAAAFPTEAPPLGLLPSPSSIPGDSTDAHMDPRAFAPPADLGHAVPMVSDLDRLHDRHLLLPVEGLDVKGVRDNFAEARGGRVHEAIDLLAPRGTPVLAVDDGVVKKLFTSKPGGLTVYQYDPSETYAYYYAHLDRYAEGLAEGKALKKGDRIGYVGTSGNAPPGTPHLHFTIFKLGPERRWWEGTPINPFPLWALRR